MVTKHREQAKVEVQGRMNRKQANKKKECIDLLQGLIIRKFKVMSQSQVRVTVGEQKTQSEEEVWLKVLTG